MYLPATHPLSIKSFTFNLEKRTMTAFASDFGAARDGTPWLVQLWDDACDVGIVLVSHFTGKEERFYLERREINAEGDLVAYHFKPVEKLANVETVTIFND